MVQYLVTETVSLADEQRHGITVVHLVVRQVLVVVVYAFQCDGQRPRADTERDHRREVARQGAQTELTGDARLRGESDLRAAVAGPVVVHQNDGVLREVHTVAATAEVQQLGPRVDESRGHQSGVAADAVVLRAAGHVDEKPVVRLVKTV